MKILTFIFIALSMLSNLAFAAEGPEGCAEIQDSPISESNLHLIQNFMSVSEFTIKQKQESFNKINIEKAHSFLNSLPEDEQKNINDLIVKLKNTKEGLVTILESEGSPLLLVKGLDYSDFPHEWIKPFAKIFQKNQPSYFFKWDKFNSMDANRDQLIEVIRSILEKHQGKKLTIIGYSAGGVITILAMDKLASDPIAQQIQFNTIASPFYGYRAPPVFSFIAAPAVGKTTIQIGIGNDKELANKKLFQCSHWVTTNCEMDQHSCEYLGMSPQLGKTKEAKSSTLPCGADHIHTFNNESHSSILSRAFDEITK